MTAEEWDQMTGWSQDQADNAYVTTAVLTAIEAAEAEARDVFDTDITPSMNRWASDRLRLCARDRAALERHHAPPPDRDLCYGCMRPYPCPDVQALIAYWQGETP